MNKYVRTYDMKTFHMPRTLPEHTYILSTHCTKDKKFAVLVDFDSQQDGTKVGRNTPNISNGETKILRVLFK